MQQSIKFRAWVKPLKRMAVVKGWVENSVFLESDTGSGSRDLVDVILMQYTGLRDRKGTEAYQDDLYQPWGDDRVYQIVWNDDDAKFDLKQVTGKRWPCDMMMIPYSDGGIIGNIHTNHELLEKTS